MEEGWHTAVFCTADVPLITLESFIERNREDDLGNSGVFQFEIPGLAISDYLVLMTSKDVSEIHHGMSSPVQPFTSPFIGYTIEEVVEWFKENVRKPKAKGYKYSGFIVLESEAVASEESGKEICTLVSLNEEPYETVRCEFCFALLNACRVNLKRSFDDMGMRVYARSGIAMTVENHKMIQYSGVYMDGMEPKVDKYWKDFVDKWSK